jgi:AcrR family transcriptional regulator
MTDAPEPPEEGQRRRTGLHAARVGGRSERVVRDVLRATAAELSRVGYAALRVEDVAAGAGVNKTTVYRRWPTKAELVTAALRARVDIDHEPPNTGSLRADLRELARRNVCLLSTAESRAIARVMMAEMDHPDVAAVGRALREERIAPWIAAIRAGIARGEIPAGSDPILMIDLILGALFSRLKRLEPMDDAHVDAVVDLVVLGAQHGGAVPR